MFLDLTRLPPPPPPEPEPRRPKLTKGDETVLFWIIGANLLLLLVAPFAGASLIGAILALLGG